MKSAPYSDESHRRTEDGGARGQTSAGDLARCHPGDFDGHTPFAMLSAEQRLEWADRAARMFLEFQGRAAGTVRPGDVEP